MIRFGAAVWVQVTLLVFVTSGCEPDRKTTSTSKAERSVGSSPTAQRPLRSQAPASPANATPDTADEDSESFDAPDASQESSRFVVDELVNLAPAGPASASNRGIVMVTKDQSVLVARLGKLSRSTAPARTPLGELDVTSERLASLGRGPAIVGKSVYWIADGRLWRSSLDGGKVEMLAADARNYTRVAAPSPAQDEVAAVAYLATSPTDASLLRARLWVDGHGSFDLSPDGAAASSVALASGSGNWTALALEGRTGMSSLHARNVRFAKTGPQISEDVVVWVGGSAQPLTEVAAMGAAPQSWAFIAVERDVTHFGLARIRIESEPKSESVVHWWNYPNGIDPAPIATALLCGTPSLLFVRPSSTEPHSPQELHVAELEPEGRPASTVVGRGRAFSDVSIATLPEGALLSYVADRATWAVTLRCQRP